MSRKIREDIISELESIQRNVSVFIIGFIVVFLFLIFITCFLFLISII